MKDIMTLLGIDGVAGTVIYLADPNFLKWILGLGIASLIAFLFFIKQGRVSIYGSNLVMAFVAAMHFVH